MAEKYDAVLEAVHMDSDGRLGWARIYERMGPVFSDRTIWKRDRLVARLKQGAKILVGTRITQMGNSFEVSQPLKLLENNGEPAIVIGDTQSDSDNLGSVPRI